MFPVALPDIPEVRARGRTPPVPRADPLPVLDRLLHTPVPTSRSWVAATRVMSPPSRVREVGRLAHEKVSIAVIERAAPRREFRADPEELAQVIELWLDGGLGRWRQSTPLGVRLVDPRDEGK